MSSVVNRNQNHSIKNKNDKRQTDKSLRNARSRQYPRCRTTKGRHDRLYLLPEVSPLPMRASGLHAGCGKACGCLCQRRQKEIEILADRFSLDYIQLHGNESPEYCHSLRSTGLRLIKAFSIARRKDFENTEAYEKSCDYFLFDTKCEQHGGSGNQFDWTMLNSYKGKKPFLLSGGINPYSAPTLKELRHPQLAGFDLNSRFEAKPGLKEVERLKFFLEQLGK